MILVHLGRFSKDEVKRIKKRIKREEKNIKKKERREEKKDVERGWYGGQKKIIMRCKIKLF